MRLWGRLVAAPTDRKLVPAPLKVMRVAAWLTPSAVGTVPRLLPPKSTFKRLKPTRKSFTILEVMLKVSPTNIAWLSAVTLTGYPAAASPKSLVNPLPPSRRQPAHGDR